jgi:hypothetical protein
LRARLLMFVKQYLYTPQPLQLVKRQANRLFPRLCLTEVNRRPAQAKLGGGHPLTKGYALTSELSTPSSLAILVSEAALPEPSREFPKLELSRRTICRDNGPGG